MPRPKGPGSKTVSTRIRAAGVEALDSWRGENSVAWYLRELLKAEAKARANGRTLLLKEEA